MPRCVMQMAGEQTCVICHGTGHVLREMPHALDALRTPCPCCRGAGRVVFEEAQPPQEDRRRPRVRHAPTFEAALSVASYADYLRACRAMHEHPVLQITYMQWRRRARLRGMVVAGSSRESEAPV